MELLSLNWYISQPIDFEQKQYMLYAYLQNVDKSFLQMRVSPHLLHLERLNDNMMDFYQKFTSFDMELESKRYKYFCSPALENKENEFLTEVFDIVDFSIPLVRGKILQGYKILKKNDQILY